MSIQWSTAKLWLFFANQVNYCQQEIEDLPERFSSKTAYVGQDEQWYHFNWIFMVNKMEVLVFM